MRLIRFTLVLAAILPAVVFAQANRNPVALESISQLVFRNGDVSHRARSRSVPTMICVGGTARCDPDLLPSSVTCKNAGWDGEDVSWECSAELLAGIVLGRADVICEGWNSAEDPLIRPGSCSLEYTVDDRRPPERITYSIPKSHPLERTTKSQLLFPVAVFAFFVILVFLVGIGLAWCASCHDLYGPTSVPMASESRYPRRPRPRGDVDIVRHTHDDVGCDGARRTHHYHHGIPPTPAPWTSTPTPSFSSWTSPPKPMATQVHSSPTHTSKVGAKTRRI